MSNEKHNNHQDEEIENEMVDSFDDVVDLGKEMEQISEENDEEKLNKSHDAETRSDLDE
ncbi:MULTISPECIES: SAS053 family DNA gyrase inhibitor [Staphylococcus]|uniref:Staphylococcal protein n=1 Tax=Staphylococcus arlettae TaxID=29378 RepID=A0A380CA96_9STAP|nr:MULTISPECIES: SAS053 family protein [Staphylococcus]EJY96398.1 hypothetical protein SARL_02195 [Staphylococcus arlettae CVD059]ERF49242.1 hypothetical protein N039_11065 [Staphylococcus sp. EGD-HP3]MBF0738816.1 hypothetical protein [Staphylococcus arlettae]MBK3720453.1 hypothetical protein [Staphylococcus arlettae]MCD8816814.1 hypothetical protein [Staphylococcus arlettae]